MYTSVHKSIINALKGLVHVSFFEHDGHLYNFVVANVEKPLIEYALEKTGGNQVKSARMLGLNRNTLHSKIKKLNINVQQFKA